MKRARSETPVWSDFTMDQNSDFPSAPTAGTTSLPALPIRRTRDEEESLFLAETQALLRQLQARLVAACQTASHKAFLDSAFAPVHAHLHARAQRTILRALGGTHFVHTLDVRAACDAYAIDAATTDRLIQQLQMQQQQPRNGQRQRGSRGRGKGQGKKGGKGDPSNGKNAGTSA